MYERPALCLSEQKLEILQSDLRQISSHILDDKSLYYGVLDPHSDAMSRSLITVIYNKEENRPIAFNAMPFLDVEVGGRQESVLHLGLVMVDPSAQSKGLSSMLYGFSCALLFLKNQMRPMWISSVTQVPAVVGLVSELYSDTYPGLKGKRRSFDQKLLAQAVMKQHRSAFGVGLDANFDACSFIISNAYTGGSDVLKKTYDATAKHRIEDYNTLCHEQLDYDRGDDFLQIGVLDRRALQNYILRMIPDGNFLGVLTAFLFFVFKALLLPTLYWFDNQKQWGGLRPYEK